MTESAIKQRLDEIQEEQRRIIALLENLNAQGGYPQATVKQKAHEIRRRLK